MDIINRILNLMAERQVKAKQLVTDLGIQKNAVSEWKSGRIKPSLSDIIKLSDYLHTTTDFILKGNLQNIVLSREEESLLHNFRKLREKEQMQILGYMDCLLASAAPEQQSTTA